MDPRDQFDPNVPIDDEPETALTDTGEPAPTGIRTAGTTQVDTVDEGPRVEPSETGTPPHSEGMPGGGVGRRDEIGGETGVHRFEDAPADSDMPVRTGAEWGQGERGPAGYHDAGTSEGSPAGTAEELLED